MIKPDKPWPRPMDKPKCKTCIYFISGKYETGSCRRYPITTTTKFASEGYWCGEHPDFPKYIEQQKKIEEANKSYE
jgi:hypothetical protein